MAQTRLEQLKRFVFASDRDFEGIFDFVKGITLDQDQIAWGLTDKELLFLGAVIKVAGMHGVEVTIRGKVDETEIESSGEISKAAAPNKG